MATFNFFKSPTNSLQLLSKTFFAGILISLCCCSGGGGGNSGGGSESNSDSGSSSGSGNSDNSGSGAEFKLSSCATKDLDQGNLSILQNLLNDFLTAKQITPLAKETYAPIQVIFHVISKGDSYEDGNVPDSQLIEQIDILNREFSGARGGAATPFRFELAGIDRVRNADWFTMAPGSDAEIAAKKALHSGTAQTLNIYTVNTEGGILGFSTFPIVYLLVPEFDGVVMNFKSLPGGTFSRYNEGLVAVHEVGHWMGLLHTFQGECGAINDLVQDTPAEKIPTQGNFCPAEIDSCPSDPGSDPVHNHMTYTDDGCRHEFSQGQLDLMRLNATIFRQLLTGA